MKRVIKGNINSDSTKRHISIIVEIDINDPTSEPVAAATYKGFYIPEGPLLPEEKGAIIGTQALEDYHAFIESVEDLFTEYYGLEIYYKNDSPSHSYYFGLLAKNSDGSIILDFDFTLRVSNHPAHRSKQSQHFKKERQAALKELSGQKKPQPVTRYIIVNNNTFSNYMDAYFKVDEEIKEVVDKMVRNRR